MISNLIEALCVNVTGEGELGAFVNIYKRGVNLAMRYLRFRFFDNMLVICAINEHTNTLKSTPMESRQTCAIVGLVCVDT